jgi:hypothetical protein
MAFTLARGYTEQELIGQQVRVYRNLHKDLWSVMRKGYVVAHADSVRLSMASFKVLPGGYDRFQREQTKNVHAFVCGTLVSLDAQPLTFPTQEVTYNPRVSRMFHTVEKCFKGREFFFDENQILAHAFCGNKTVWVSNYTNDAAIV